MDLICQTHGREVAVHYSFGGYCNIDRFVFVLLLNNRMVNNTRRVNNAIVGQVMVMVPVV